MINRVGRAQGLQVICLGLRREVCTHGVRQANVTVGMVRAAAVDLVRVAGLLHHHGAGLHRFWSAEQGDKTKSPRYSRERKKEEKTEDGATWSECSSPNAARKCALHAEPAAAAGGGDTEKEWREYGCTLKTATLSGDLGQWATAQPVRGE